MRNQLVSFKVAKLAREKHYWAPIFVKDFYYDNGTNKLYCDMQTYAYDSDIHIFAPTQAELQKWLREEKDLFVYCVPNYDEKKWYFYINNLPITKQPKHGYDTYEEALENGLEEALNLIEEL